MKRRARFEQVPLATIADIVNRGDDEKKAAGLDSAAAVRQTTKDEPYSVRADDQPAPDRRRRNS